ncbi:1-deoxy-D-xylulose 5-phosphate reductoisomerase [Desulfacinum hydrothermale DSM 13146]|uniref:1-deoxy-D-xylulose 5-phosphate reductoisomerase n=1 Tax=Desulfacinum hydrothermale DSM 13146 TaxID=1121390 RepID=A0A1W1XNP4_9BACT|nr:1-deoxy-D-xylulose-5-phosphate reductoisomerase [Desulfacinum hydrothermale]SMC25141.1 1-deoxy-D-xylulose 5-phosphate reductoisomerase [Desulfacinum hydrothermale DSM 13146]
MKRLTILGSTGSIGVSTLEVVGQFPDAFQVVGLGAGRNVRLLADQIRAVRPLCVAVLDETAAGELAGLLGPDDPHPEILWGPEGYRRVATLDSAHMVVSAIVGAAGLLPTLAAIDAGKDIALANKETLVIAGQVVMERVGRRGVRLFPVDSEHSAIFQALQGNPKKALKRILLTASGGPFFGSTAERLESVTPQAALRHPNWAMGPKITIDSATLMNKGLEVIEAHWLFQVPVETIHVHIHPESIIHSMVEYVDGSVIAQMGVPDMKIPIAYALSYPDRLPVSAPTLDLFDLGTLTFHPPDMEAFPCLRLAYEAAEAGGTLPAVLNAANEVAVQAFLDGALGFMDIPRLIEEVMAAHPVEPADSVERILDADRWAREKARDFVLHRGYAPSAQAL